MLRPTKSKIGDWSGSCMDNGYTIMESNYVIFIFAFISNDDQLSKERICSSMSKFFPFRVDPIMRRLRQQRKRTVITQVMSPSENITWRCTTSKDVHFKDELLMLKSGWY